MENTLFSIVVPTFNSDKTVRNCLNSVLKQSYSDFEVLVMDGLSIDKTLEVVNSLKDDRIRIYSEKDAGVYDAMNKSIHYAKGKWMLFLGSDDEMMDHNVLSDLYEYIKDEPTLDVLYGDVIFKNAGIKYYGTTSLERILLENNLCHQSIFYNRSIFEKIGKYNLKYNLYADWDLNIRCFMHPDFTIKYISRVISIYNETGGISAKFVNTDINFLKTLPRYNIEINREQIFKSKEYKIGVKVLKPLRLLKKGLKKLTHIFL